MSSNVRKIQIHFRWDAEQTGPRQVEVKIPTGEGPMILNPEFVRALDLTDREIIKTEDKVLESLVIID